MMAPPFFSTRNSWRERIQTNTSPRSRDRFDQMLSDRSLAGTIFKEVVISTLAENEISIFQLRAPRIREGEHELWQEATCY